jgi:choline dehydrogenase
MHDVVIVGAGAAGCVLASRLTEDPNLSVLLLEAGPRPRKLEVKIPAAFSRLYRTKLDWGDSTVPQSALDGREVVFPRGRMLGGSASMNAMMILRGHRADYDGWVAAGCSGWGWADVAPAFARSADGAFPIGELPERHVLAEAFVHAAQAAGIPFAPDLNAESNEGVGFVPVSQRRGRRFSVVDGYLKPARRRPNLTIVTGALATRVVVERGRAIGVAFRPDGKGQDELAQCASEVILCAGAIGTPHLLQLSGIGPSAALEEAGVEVLLDVPAVGANLLDHLANGLLVRTRGVETLASADSLRNLARWALRGRGPLTCACPRR